MKPFLFLLSLLFAAVSNAAPFAQANVSAGTLQCGFYLDSAAVVVVSVVGSTCKLDLATVAVGAHVVAVDARGDPLWVANSAKSANLNFSRPSPPTVPTGLAIVP